MYEQNWIGSTFIEIIYLISSMVLLLNYRKTVQRSSAGSEQKLPLMFIIFLSMYILLFLVDLSSEFFGSSKLFYNTLPLLLTTLWFFAVIYLLLMWPREYEAVKEVLKSEQKYEKCALSKKEATAVFVQITNALDTSKLFLDPNLTLQSLANEIGATTHEVSFCINSETGENFATFIGSFRVNEAKRLLATKTNSDYSIQQIALQAGFSSKSTFNRIFKKITGKTPSQFRDSL